MKVHTTWKRSCVIFTLVAAMLFCGSITSCGSAGGKSASSWNGTWYREGESPFCRCYVEISDAGSSGFSFTLTAYNGSVVSTITDGYAEFDGEIAYYYAEDPRSYVEFFFDESETSKLDIIFVTTGEQVEWTAFDDFYENTYITGIFSREESYINDSLYEMGILSSASDNTLNKLMGDTMYFRLVCCFQTYTSEESEPTGTNAPYEYGGVIHLHDGIGGTIYYGSMNGQQYAACVIDFDDGTVSAVVSSEDGSLSYYSNNSIYSDSQPYPILVWMESYTAELNGELDEDEDE